MPLIWYSALVKRTDSPFLTQIERICRSEVFQSAPRLRDFLTFLVAHPCGKDGGSFKESVIGVEFFRRTPGYDPKKDPIVRVEAHRLRRRLRAYYSQEGAGDKWRVNLPKGSYSPVFQDLEESRPEWRLAVRVDCSDELTAEGLTIELISKLGTLHGVTVLAPRSALAAHDNAGAVRILGANAILECRLDGMNLQAKLSQADLSGLTPLGTFDNIIQPAVDALQRFVASSLGVGRHHGGEPLKRQVIDRESYQFYLSGRAWFHRWSPDNLAQAAAHFDKVIERCPNYAPAYAGLADVQVLLAYWHVPNAYPTLEKGRSHALRALELDPTCAEAYCSLAAFDATLKRDWEGSEANFRRALAANPSNALALNWLSIIALIPRMRFEEAVDAVFAAYDLDPASPEIGNEIVWVRLCCRQFEESAEQGRRIIALHPSFLEAYWSLALAEFALGRYSHARGALNGADQLAPGAQFTLALRALIEGSGGKVATAKQCLEGLQECAQSAPVRDLYYCWAYTGLGDLDRAIEYLQRAIGMADPLALYIDVFVPFDRLRSHPDYEQCRRKQRLSST